MTFQEKLDHLLIEKNTIPAAFVSVAVLLTHHLVVCVERMREHEAEGACARNTSVGRRSVRGSRRMPCVTRHRGERASERSMGGLPQLLTLRTLQQCERRLEQVLIEEGTDRLDHGAAESIRTRTGGKPDGEWCVVAAKQLHHATFHGLGQRLDDRGL